MNRKCFQSGVASRSRHASKVFLGALLLSAGCPSTESSDTLGAGQTTDDGDDERGDENGSTGTPITETSAGDVDEGMVPTTTATATTTGMATTTTGSLTSGPTTTGSESTTTGPPPIPEGGLAGVFGDDFTVGVAVEPQHLAADGELIATHFNRLTAENSMKFSSLQPTEGNFTWTNADTIANFARERNMPMTGHTLVWHRQTPAWVFADLTPGDPDSIEILRSRMQTHIEAVVGRYGDVVDNWDVVNEVISDDSSQTYRDGDEGSDWYAYFGSEEYVYWAFRYTYDALEAQSPGSAAGKLYYNDYNANLKIERIIPMLDDIREQGVPVDGIGLQAHWRLDWPPVSEIEQTILTAVDAGYAVKISELDLTIYNDYPSGEFTPAPEIEFTEELEAMQAQRYVELFELFRRYNVEVTSVSVWGLSDDQTWLDNEPVSGRNNHPLLFDDNREPKQALIDLLAL